MQHLDDVKGGNVPHSAYARTAVKVLDAFSPVREDYRVIELISY